MTTKVAGCAPLAGATAQLTPAGRNRGATPALGGTRDPPMTATELRAQLRAQQERNRGATAVLDWRVKVAAVAQAQLGRKSPTSPFPQLSLSAERKRISANDDRMGDAGMETRRLRVLATLAQHPDLRYAVITDSDAEPGTVIVHIGIRGVASGEIVIAKASYDGIVLLRASELTR